MAKRKANMHMRTKSVTLEGASTQDTNQELNQEMHEASTQGMGFWFFESIILKIHTQFHARK